jgi:crotonobetainyl-CoA:carnitine CoA-transferase CaiB-like acyl-CoA transferase
MEILGNSGVPAGAVYGTDELINDPFLQERGMFPTINHPVRGDLKMPGWPVKMSDSCVPVRSAPLLGQDNLHVYGQLLGYTAEQLSALKAQEVI